MDSAIDHSCDNHDAVISMLRSSHAAISAVLLSSIAAEREIAHTDRRLLLRRRSLAAISVASKSQHERINRAADRPSAKFRPQTVMCVPAVQRLQEVEFLRRTKAADQKRIWRIKEDVAALRKVNEQEIGKVNYNYKGHAEALVRIRDEYKMMLRRLRHADVYDIADGWRRTDGEDRLAEWVALGSIEERAVLRRLSEILASNGCRDSCIDIFVKVRTRQATKALARLNLDTVNRYTPKDIDRAESLDPAISLWICHLLMAVTSVLPAEKHLCRAVLSSAFYGTLARLLRQDIPPHHRVALSPTEPQQLIKLLKMTDTARRLRPAVSAVFDDCVPKISARARDLEKLLVGSAFRAFSSLNDGIQNDSPLPTDASVPSIVLYGVNFLKCQAADGYAQSVARPNPDEALKESFINVLEALQRNVEAVWEMFRDRVAAHVFAMNTNWYMYIKTRETELAIFIGEEKMRRRYKGAAEAAAYAYQAEAWEPMGRMLEKGEVAGFMSRMKENLRRHHRGYGIQDADLREQIKEAVLKMLVSAYEGFLHVSSGMVQGSGFVRMEDISAMLSLIFDDGSGKDGRRREKKDADEMIASASVALPGRERRKGRSRTTRYTRLQFGNQVGSKAGE
ncbi:hypothetical protein IEQ34_026571 [Dendrobium chrysotoxum]|uniref:Exocyst subunit Exo70 family protein n=1 Tax=Dendrobium chrysotoxum TaxID=161865 RepID=A0AAV7FM24_DENCH|nr:hypothetical protein IEQ34_026571 [Dendrobium chrysotoxum]